MTDVHPKNMHTDAQSGGSVTPCNMHTDMVVGKAANGAITLSAKNSSGVATSVTITSSMASSLGRALGLAAAPECDPHAPAAVAPFNMHTDAQTTITADPSGTSATIDGPADGPHGTARVRVTIDGPALAMVKGSHAGI